MPTSRNSGRDVLDGRPWAAQAAHPVSLVWRQAHETSQQTRRRSRAMGRRSRSGLPAGCELMVAHPRVHDDRTSGRPMTIPLRRRTWYVRARGRRWAVQREDAMSADSLHDSRDAAIRRASGAELPRSRAAAREGPRWAPRVRAKLRRFESCARMTPAADEAIWSFRCQSAPGTPSRLFVVVVGGGPYGLQSNMNP